MRSYSCHHLSITFLFSAEYVYIMHDSDCPIPIHTRSSSPCPHVRGRWARAGGTSWAHQAQSITQWQEPLDHGGASVEPQVRMYGVGWDSFYHIKYTARAYIDVTFCMQALYLTHMVTPWHVNMCCTCAHVYRDLSSHIWHSHQLHLWHCGGQAEVTSPAQQHLSSQPT